MTNMIVLIQTSSQEDSNTVDGMSEPACRSTQQKKHFVWNVHKAFVFISQR